MRRIRILGPVLALLLPFPSHGCAQEGVGARAALRAGEYASAIDAYSEILSRAPRDAEARVGLMEALIATGAYGRAVDVAREAPEPVAVANALGEALLLTGERASAEAAFRRAAESPGPWALSAEVNLAEVLFLRGEVEEAMRRFDRFIDRYNQASGRMSARDLVAVGRAVQYLGRRDPELFQDALRAFDEAARLDPAWEEPSVRAGALFLEKYSSPEAQEEFRRVLERNPNHPGALFGMARALEFDRSTGGQEALDQLFRVNPNHVEGRALSALLLLSNESYSEALSEVERALAVNPTSLEALAALAAIHMVSGDTRAFEEARERALVVGPRHAGLDATLAEIAAQTRRYDEAVSRAQAAISLDSSSWEGWGLLGMNQLRTGDVAAGRGSLERAFQGDPYNPWFKNTLDLLDTFERFETVETPHFHLFLHGDESELLAGYLEPLAEEAYEALSGRYGIEPATPIRAEFFPSHADFSVRTLGEAGLGALGVSFGSVLVMDSPSAREQGAYNWASVFWHELAHTFHLALTDHRVPRWFSEGLAVHEQRKAREGWGHQPSLPFLTAIRNGRLKQVSELNDGFMRPDYPEQVIFSYYQASLVFEMIEDRWGFEAIQRILEGYRTGASTEQLFETHLGLSADEMDRDFEAFLEARFRDPLRGVEDGLERPGREADVGRLEDFVRAHPGDFIGRLRLGGRLLDERRLDDAEEHLRAALRIFPEYGGPDSPYRSLARIHRLRGELEQAAAALARLNALSESDYSALLEEAEVLRELDRSSEAASVLERAVQVWPYDISVHETLAELHETLGNARPAVRERRAIVALGPPDRAEALYRLALAQRSAGDPEGARRSVLAALEVAPTFDRALELLLELRSGGGS